MVCGISLRYINPRDIDTQQRAAQWIQVAESHLKDCLGNPTLADIQAIGLVVFDHLQSRRFVSLMAWLSLAVRFSYLLQLNHENKSLPFLERESRRRLMWALWVMDTWTSDGRKELILCPANSMRIMLPCDERSFALNIEVQTEHIVPLGRCNEGSTPGLIGYLLRAMNTRHEIQRSVERSLTRNLFTKKLILS